MKLSKPIPVLKSEAKQLAKADNITRTEALNRIAVREGFQAWSDLSANAESKPDEELPPEITAVPLTGALRREAIRIANHAFERALWRMEAENPKLAMKLWDVESYVNNTITEDMLPIETDYGLSLLEAFMIHTALDIAMEADHQAENELG
ncbi:hypothetical protein [Ruegeria lacuscaerulensis]|uniref:hypothetical protein n=1 Tax=Ruegeria lacuscaerulensis TaxID=55218 RepID=UPI001480BBAE|nr:hypothetical protein [Ruegeria lacuscaerulensis]